MEYLNVEQAFFGIKVQTTSSGYMDNVCSNEKMYSSFSFTVEYSSLAFLNSRAFDILNLLLSH